jgi:hypothetical protein
MTVRRNSLRILAAFMAAMLVACGGGGGGGDGGGGGETPSPVVYVGVGDAAAISAQNASALVSIVLGSGDAGEAIAGLRVGQGSAAPGPRAGLAGHEPRVSRELRDALSRAGSAREALGGLQPVDLVDDCDSGYVRTYGTLNDDLTGTLNLDYNSCEYDGDVLSGRATVRVDAVDFVTLTPTDYTISFPRLTMRGAGLSIDTGGTLRVLTLLAAQAEELTENFVTLDNLTGAMTKTENLVFANVYDSLFSPTSVNGTVDGRIFHSAYGYVDVTSSMPLNFSTLAQRFPDGGRIRLAGAGGRSLRVDMLSAALLTVALDVDGDGVIENVATLTWTSLAGPVGADLGDDDGDGMHNAWEQAYGLNRNDAGDVALDGDGDGVTNLAEYQGGSDPGDAGSIPPIVGGTVPGQVITLANNSGLVFDPVSGTLFAAVLGNPGAIVPVDPLTGTTGTPIPVGIDPVKLALADNGQYLYVGLDGENAFQRIDVAAQAVDLTVPLVMEPTTPPYQIEPGTALYAEDMAVLPANPQSLAVSRMLKNSSPRHAGVVVYDGGVMRATTTPGHTGSNVITFSASAGTLYGYNNETTLFGFYIMAVDSSGVAIVDVVPPVGAPGSKLISGFGVDIDFHNGLIYTSQARVIDPVAKVEVGSFSMPSSNRMLVAPDAGTGRVFILRRDSASGVWSIAAYDIGTRLLLATENIPGVAGDPGDLLRWGARGLAFRTSGGQIYLIRSTLLIP